MAVVITPQKEIDKYYDSERVNQSKLKDLISGLDSFLANQDKDYKNNESFIIGSAVDTILTGEEGEFENQYFTLEVENKPSDTEIEIITEIFNRVTELYPIELWKEKTIHSFKGIVLEVINRFQWQPRWKDETRINKMFETGFEYFNALKLSHGKTILSNQQRVTIQAIVDSLKNNVKTKRYFDRDTLSKEANITVYYQLPVYFDYVTNDKSVIEAKGLLDIVIVFQKGSVIDWIQPIDLKTMSGFTINFFSNLKKYRYDIQAAWYTVGLMQHFSVTKEKVRNFMFIVESTTNIGKPLIYQLEDDLLNMGLIGRKQVLNPVGILVAREIKGIEQLAREFVFYQETGWEQDIQVAKSDNGILKLDWNGIKK